MFPPQLQKKQPLSQQKTHLKEECMWLNNGHYFLFGSRFWCRERNRERERVRLHSCLSLLKIQSLVERKRKQNRGKKVDLYKMPTWFYIQNIQIIVTNSSIFSQEFADKLSESEHISIFKDMRGSVNKMRSPTEIWTFWLNFCCLRPRIIRIDS